MTKPVGYKSPPNSTKWKKGQSGNPRGRQKGQLNLKTDLLAELAETIPISEGGHARKLTKQRALLKSLTARAIKGDTRAASIIFGLVQRILGPDDDAPQEMLAEADQARLDAFIAKKLAAAKDGQS